ncbi:hypothetical protein DFH08DRAFT_796993 [Mycena albidolilacea]|uniref:Uncharacterized protein n=1 Tax=Mycena albidolilacea TaxID=1033008 RepID=A0AAD7F7Y9_9AGAR|nr:hypothetical protein DFH08DRAFT_796993 [Mycena albidolilacea]
MWGGRRDEHAGIPVHERAHLLHVLWVHPRLGVGPGEGSRRGDWVVGTARADVAGAGGEIGGGQRRKRERDVRLAVVPVLVLSLERETGETVRKARLDTRQRQGIRWKSIKAKGGSIRREECARDEEELKRAVKSHADGIAVMK